DQPRHPPDREPGGRHRGHAALPEGRRDREGLRRRPRRAGVVPVPEGPARRGRRRARAGGEARPEGGVGKGAAEGREDGEGPPRRRRIGEAVTPPARQDLKNPLAWWAARRDNALTHLPTPPARGDAPMFSRRQFLHATGLGALTHFWSRWQAVE